jgi:hypothetical protein
LVGLLLLVAAESDARPCPEASAAAEAAAAAVDRQQRQDDRAVHSAGANKFAFALFSRTITSGSSNAMQQPGLQEQDGKALCLVKDILLSSF